MSHFDDIREIHLSKTVTSISDMPAPEARQGSMAWVASPRKKNVLFMFGRDNRVELDASRLSSAPPRRMIIEKLE